MWKTCMLLLCWSQIMFAHELLNTVSFLKSYCHENGSKRILVFTSWWGRLYSDWIWWKFTNLMLKESISLQVSDSKKWCDKTPIPEGRKHLIVLMYHDNAQEVKFLQECSDKEQIGPKHNWLLLTFHHNKSSSLAILETINLRLDSNFVVGLVNANGDIELLEVYKPGRNAQITVKIFGNWTCASETLLGFPREYKYMRRQNLFGYQMQAVTVLVNNFYTQIQRMNNKYEVSGGYFGNIFLILQERLNFTYSLHYLVGYSYGNIDKDDQNWTGLIGVLQRKEADISVSEVSVVSGRLDVIGFSLPVHQVARRLYVHLGAKVSMFDYYWQPYSPCAWLTLFFLIIGMVLMGKGIQYLLSSYTSYIEHRKWHTDMFIYVSVSLQQGTEDPQYTPLRILKWTTAFTFLVINIAYGAKLTSTSTVNQETMPLANFQEILGNNWKFSVVKDSLSERMFQEASPDSVFGIVWRTQLGIKSNQLVSGVVKGLLNVIEDSTYVFMGQEDSCQQVLVENFTSEQACQIGMLSEKYFLSPLSFGLQKNSEYKSLINFHLLRLIEVGIDKRLSHKWIPRSSDCPRRTHDSAELTDVAPVFAIFLAGVILSVFILLLEIFYKKRKRANIKDVRWNEFRKTMRGPLYYRRHPVAKNTFGYFN